MYRTKINNHKDKKKKMHRNHWSKQKNNGQTCFIFDKGQNQLTVSYTTTTS